MNDLPVTDKPPNVTHPCCTDDGDPPPADVAELSTAHFAFDIVPAVQAFHGHLNRSKSPSDPTFGLSFEDDPSNTALLSLQLPQNQPLQRSACLIRQPDASSWAPTFLKLLMIVYSLLLRLSTSLQPYTIRGWEMIQFLSLLRSKPSSVPLMFKNAQMKVDYLQPTPNGTQMKT